MANIASSKKDARRSAERAVRNRSIRSSVKTKITKVRRAIVEGATENLTELAEAAIAGLDRAGAKGVLHRNNVARRKSRLTKRAQAAGAAAETAAAAPAAKAPARKTAAKPASKPAAKSASKPAAKASAKPAAAKKTARK